MNKKHGHATHPQSVEYQTWNRMKRRCYNQRSKDYLEYGARGIGICGLWRESFEAFLRDMGARPEGHSLDRIDSTKDYSADNCRWATASVQAHNRRQRQGKYAKGVRKIGSRFCAYLCHGGKVNYVGSFDTEAEAAAAYREAYISHWGRETWN